MSGRATSPASSRKAAAAPSHPHERYLAPDTPPQSLAWDWTSPARGAIRADQERPWGFFPSLSAWTLAGAAGVSHQHDTSAMTTRSSPGRPGGVGAIHGAAAPPPSERQIWTEAAGGAERWAAMVEGPGCALYGERLRARVRRGQAVRGARGSAPPAAAGGAVRGPSGAGAAASPQGQRKAGLGGGELEPPGCERRRGWRRRSEPRGHREPPERGAGEPEHGAGGLGPLLPVAEPRCPGCCCLAGGGCGWEVGGWGGMVGWRVVSAIPIYLFL